MCGKDNINEIKEEAKSTDEDYESDEDAEEIKITTRLLDPIEEKEIFDEFMKQTKTNFSCNCSVDLLVSSGSIILVAESQEEGLLGALFLSDQPKEECSDKQGMENFLFMSTGNDIFPLTTMYLE